MKITRIQTAKLNPKVHACWQNAHSHIEIVSLLGSRITFQQKAIRKSGKLIALYSLLMALTVIPRLAMAGDGLQGMSAKGVDAWTAIRHSKTLDVRDSLNRPVSAQKIAQEYAASSRKAAHQTDAVSGLPYAARILQLVDDFLNLRATLAALPLFLPPVSGAALPWMLRCLEHIAMLVILFLTVEVFTQLSLNEAAAPCRQARLQTIPLRC